MLTYANTHQSCCTLLPQNQLPAVPGGVAEGRVVRREPGRKRVPKNVMDFTVDMNKKRGANLVETVTDGFVVVGAAIIIFTIV